MVYSTQCRCCNNYSPAVCSGMEDDKVIKGPEINVFIHFLLLSESLHPFSTTLLYLAKKAVGGLCALCARTQSTGTEATV